MHPNDVLDDGLVSIDVGDGVSRRDVLKQVAAVSTLLGTAGCFGDETSQPTETPSPDFEFSKHPAVAPPGWEASNTASGDGLTERRAVFALYNIDHSFFAPLMCGFHDALNTFGWTGGIRGPSATGELVEFPDFINRVIDNLEAGDVLATTVLDPEAGNDAIQRALDNDIVVVNGHSTPPEREWNYRTQQAEFTDTSPVTGEDRGMIIPHVGIRNERGGVAMAAEMHERLQDQKPNQDEYSVFLVNDLPENPSVTRRVDKAAAESGTAQRYFEAQTDVDIYEGRVFETPQPPEIEESRDYILSFISGEDVDAVVSAAFWSATGAGRAREAGDLPGDLLICGFDIPGTIDPIRNGTIDFVVAQDMYGQGYRSAEIAWTWIERGVPMKNLESGVSVWDRENIEFASQRRSWGQLLEWQENNYDGIE